MELCGFTKYLIVIDRLESDTGSRLKSFELGFVRIHHSHLLIKML